MTHCQHYLDANTRRYPRTMQQAFGPYTSHQIQENPEFVWSPVRIAFAVTYALAFIVLWIVL